MIVFDRACLSIENVYVEFHRRGVVMLSSGIKCEITTSDDYSYLIPFGM